MSSETSDSSDASQPTNKKAGESLLEKVLLLVLTAILTGLLVPYINNKLADQRAVREKTEAADLARQASVLREQEQFLAQLERTIFDFHTKAAAVCWYRSQQPDEEKYAKSFAEYDTVSWKFMSDMHALLSKAKRLTSETAYATLEQHQRRWEALDLELTKQIGRAHV